MFIRGKKKIYQMNVHTICVLQYLCCSYDSISPVKFCEMAHLAFSAA